jgi:hypothetical protein
LAAVLAAASFGAAAQVVLYDGIDLRGRKLTIRTDEPNLADSDFNDRAASMLVRGGPWQICVDPDFRGDCTVLQPGEYRNLDRRFARTISSLRPMGGAARQEGSYAPPPSASPVIAVPAIPSSCSVGPVGSCSGCQVTCQPGQQANCTRGSEWAHAAGTRGGRLSVALRMQIVCGECTRADARGASVFVSAAANECVCDRVHAKKPCRNHSPSSMPKRWSR